MVNSRSPERAETAATDIVPDRNAVGITADVSNYDEVEALVDRVAAEFGSVDIMVNNAGITNIGPAEEFSAEEWREVIDVDLNGVFFGSQLAGQQMIEQGDGGAILNISSMMGDMGVRMRVPYCAAKGGVNNLTQTLGLSGQTTTSLSTRSPQDSFKQTSLIRHRTPQGTPTRMSESGRR